MKIGEIPAKTIVFFKEVKLEMKKINWPTRQETLKYTLIVIGVSLGVALFLGGLDFMFSLIIQKAILKI